MIGTLRAMPAGVRLFLGYAFLVLGAIGLALRTVIDLAIAAPVSPTGVIVMGLLAYTIFTITLTIQRKEAARALALGLASLTIPAVPLLLVSGLPLPAVLVALLAAALFVGLTRPSARTWLNEP